MKLHRKSFLCSYSRLALITYIGLTLSACQTAHQQNKQTLAAYLNQYVGQEVIQLKNINLDSFEIKLNPNSIITPERAIFSFDRSISIPIPEGNVIKDSRGFMIPAQISSAANNYNTIQSCNLIFILENNIVQSFSMKGKAC